MRTRSRRQEHQVRGCIERRRREMHVSMPMIVCSYMHICAAGKIPNCNAIATAPRSQAYPFDWPQIALVLLFLLDSICHYFIRFGKSIGNSYNHVYANLRTQVSEVYVSCRPTSCLQRVRGPFRGHSSRRRTAQW